MEKEERRKRRRGKWIFAWSAVFFLTAAVFMKDAAVVRADSPYDSYMGAVAGTNGDDIAFLSGGVAILTGDDTEGIVCSALYGAQCDEVSFFPQGGDSVSLDENKREDNSQYNYTIWKMENLDANSVSGLNAFYYPAFPVQNESVTIYYFATYGDNDVQASAASAVLRELKNESILEVDSLPDDIRLYPAAVVNERGYCVGIVTGPETVITITGSEEEFYGQSSGGGDDNGGYGEDDSDKNSGSSDNEGSDDNSNDDNNEEDEDSIDFLKNNKVFIGIVIVLIVVIVILITLLNKKKTNSSVESNSGGAAGQVRQGYIGATGPIQQNSVGPTGPIQQDSVGPTGPIQQGYGNVNFEYKQASPAPKPQVYLQAVGGCLDGRTYPVGRNEVTIGRYRTNVIIYPEGTPGVSRSHAKLYWEGGKLMLMDCNSSSGTYLKRIGKLPPMNPVEVNCGDIFYIGEKKNRFEIKK